MPKTIHPLNEAEKFVFEAWTMPGVLAPTVPGAAGEMVIFVSLHGEFMERKFSAHLPPLLRLQADCCLACEVPSKGIRSFDRTFILAPAQEGSPSALPLPHPRRNRLTESETDQRSTCWLALRHPLRLVRCPRLLGSLRLGTSSRARRRTSRDHPHSRTQHHPGRPDPATCRRPRASFFIPPFPLEPEKLTSSPCPLRRTSNSKSSWSSKPSRA